MAVKKTSKAGTKRTRKATGSKKTASKAKSPAKNKGGKKDADKRAEGRKKREEDAARKRAEAIESGALIEDGDREFHRVEETGGTMIDRANGLLEELKKSKTPVVTRELIEKRGGQFPQYLAMFSLLEAMGEVVKYRQRGGERGASQVAYLHVSHVK